jgi:predicted glycosyltransferase
MIWLDITTPKYALFFSNLIPLLKEKITDNILVTTRYSENYTEPKRILDMNNIEYKLLGNYGGIDIKDKFVARLKRQEQFIELFEKYGTPKLLISGGSVDAIQTAYGIGMPSIFFADTPIRGYEFDYKDITILSKLTIPLSSLIFHPFVIPSDVFSKMGVAPENIISHGFIDICLWMDKIVKDDKNDFRNELNIDTTKPTILIREEEYKAHYVKEKLPIIYNVIPKLAQQLDANIVIMPRYESDYLKQELSQYATILDKKLKPEEFYPFIDLLIGGGGTMNIEASYYGIPVISTRSLWLYHDKYMIDNDLMKWTDSEDEVLALSHELIGKKFDNKPLFCKEKCDFNNIVKKISQFMENI